MATKLTERHDKVKAAISDFIEYVDTYPEQSGYTSYSDKTIVRDMVYGLGLALWGEDAKGPSGYERTVSRVKELL